MILQVTTAKDILEITYPPAIRKHFLPEPFTPQVIKQYRGVIPFMDTTLYATIKGRGLYRTIDLDLYKCSFNLTKDIQAKIMSAYIDYLNIYKVTGGRNNSFTTNVDICLKVRTEDVNYWLGTLGITLNNPESTYDIGL